MDQFMQQQVCPGHEGFPTVQTMESVLPSMDHLVHFERGVRDELFPAGCANVHFLSGVGFLVLEAVRLPNVAFPALRTHEAFLLVGVQLHFGNPAKIIPTVGADVGELPCADSLLLSAVGADVEFLSHVGPLVGQEIRAAAEGLVAMPTLVTLFLRVRVLARIEVGALAEAPCIVRPLGVEEGRFSSSLEKPL